MPELPEVETVMQGLIPVMEGYILREALVRRKDLRAPFPENFAKRLKGRRIERMHRRAKYIIADLDSAESLIVHLGMSGRMGVFREGHEPVKHDHVIFVTDAATIAFNDPRRFGMMTLIPTDNLENAPVFAGLGPEPLSNAFNGPVLAAALSRKRTPVKSALLDQRVVAGLGNIYVCESLFRAGIAPTRLACDVTEAETDALTRAIRAVLKQAISEGGSSLRDARYVRTGGELGYFQNKLKVYDREGQPCARKGCHGKVVRIVQSGRSSFYCPECQH